MQGLMQGLMEDLPRVIMLFKEDTEAFLDALTRMIRMIREIEE
jgi:hypothetical protein